ncbi:MAG: subtilase family N-terminal domain-containing protein, partial [Alistipes sp.]
MVKKQLLIFAVLLAAGCTSEPMTEMLDSTTPPAASQKIINTTAGAAEGSLIVYFDDEAIVPLENSAAEAVKTRSVATRSGINAVDGVLSNLNVTSLRRVFPDAGENEARTREAGLHKWYVLTFASTIDLNAAALQLAAVADVECIQFNTQVEKASDCKVIPMHEVDMPATRGDVYRFNDPALPRQWNYVNKGYKTFAPLARPGADVNAEAAWQISGGNPAVIVAIVDEGVKYSHPDLAANMWVNPKPGKAGDTYVDDLHGYNFVTRGPLSWTNPSKKDEEGGDSGHGTHVAGTVAAVNNNGIGVAGVAGGTGKNDGVKLMSCQIYSGAPDGSGGAPGSGAAATTAEAIKYAADHGASIIQCSFGYQAEAFKSDAAYIKKARVEQEAIEYFIHTKNCTAIDGGLAIFAAGNDSKAMAGYPGAYRDYISVTSISPDYQPAYYTNYGPGCNIAAPGGDAYLVKTGASQVLSTLPSELYNNEDYG